MPPVLLLSLSVAFARGPAAASTLQNLDGSFPAELAFDGLLQTGWAEGSAGYGEGEWLELDLEKAVALQGVSFWPGNIKQGERSYREYTRPKLVRILVDGKETGEPIRLLDKIQRVDVPLKGIQGRTIRIQVDEVFEGIVYTDMFISEVAVNYPMGDYEDRLDRWLEGKEAVRLAEELDQQITDAYERYKAAQFGDEDALAFLMDLAADGPEYLRPRVLQLVPTGFRAQAVRPSEKAQEALRKLKDANAIPAVEMAALRATGPRQQELLELVEIFKAYQELISGGDRNVPYWGQSGWETGALRSFDEPLAVEIDRFNNVLVADTGNNRVQKYDELGKPVRTWGAQPDLANSWFGVGRPWYVAGAKPGEAPGEWTQPVDLDLIPGKDDDSWVGIDTLGRVQVFDAEGHPVISWRVETKKRPEPKLGGQAYVLWIPKREWLVAIVQNEVVCYTLDSEEVLRWRLQDGTPNAAEVSKNGKLLLAFGPNIVQYDPDGFRFGAVIGNDILGEGWEDLDLTLDEKGKLWVVTDTGWVYKFKRPGKVELKIRAVDQPLFRHRIAVKEGMLFFTNRDKVNQVDVLQVKNDQEQAAERAKRGEEEEVQF